MVLEVWRDEVYAQERELRELRQAIELEIFNRKCRLFMQAKKGSRGF